jgi:hypothetical protein
MPDSINFVKDRRRQHSKREVQERLWFRWSVIVTVGMVVVSLLMVGGRLLVDSQLKGLQTQQATLKKEIVGQESVERALRIYNQKLAVLKSIFEKRSNKQAAISYFSEVFGPTVLIKEIAYEAGDDVISFNVEAADIFELQRIFGILDNQKTRDQFAQISRSDLKRSSDGSYEVNVVVTLKSAAKAKKSQVESS